MKQGRGETGGGISERREVGEGAIIGSANSSLQIPLEAFYFKKVIFKMFLLFILVFLSSYQNNC